MSANNLGPVDFANEMFRDFLAALWPVDDTSKSVTGKRLSGMYRALNARHKQGGSSSTAANGSSHS